jgi:phosphoglycerol transferase
MKTDSKKLYSNAAVYCAGALLSLVGMTLVLQLWKADLSIPFQYRGDAIAIEALAKTGIDESWYLHNGFIGMPTGRDMCDYPIPDNVHLLSLKFLSLITADCFVVVNAYFLLGFPFAVITSLFVLRRYNISAMPALVAGLLYAFLPYHFSRGLSHLFLSSYYLVPLSVLVCLWVYSEAPPFFDKPHGVSLAAALRTRKTIVAIAICLIVSAGGAYYASFSIYFLVIAGVAGALRYRSPRHLFAVKAKVPRWGSWGRRASSCSSGDSSIERRTVKTRQSMRGSAYLTSRPCYWP